MGCAFPTPAQLLGGGWVLGVTVSSAEGCALNFSRETPIAVPKRDPAPPPSWSVTPSSSPEACGDWVRWGRTMEEKPFKASLAKSSARHDSMKSNPHRDIRNLWTMATLSQPKVNAQLPKVYEDSELEGSSVGSKTRGWYDQKSGHDLDGGLEEWDDRDDNVSFKQGELDDHTLLDLESHLGEEDEDSRMEMEISSSVASLSISKHTPHRAYWVEQQTRLPLPLVELMENEALEILTKALWSYRSGIGSNHFLTKQLQRNIEGLKRRRNKRLNVSVS